MRLISVISSENKKSSSCRVWEGVFFFGPCRCLKLNSIHYFARKMLTAFRSVSIRAAAVRPGGFPGLHTHSVRFRVIICIKYHIYHLLIIRIFAQIFVVSSNYHSETPGSLANSTSFFCLALTAPTCTLLHQHRFTHINH